MAIDVVAVTALVCLSGIGALHMVLRAAPRADRWLEFERVITTLETRCKKLERDTNAHADAIGEHYARLDTLRGQSFAPLPALAELRDEMSAHRHSTGRQLDELEKQTGTLTRAVEVMNSEFARRMQEADEKASRLSSLLGQMRPGGMRT